MRVFAGLIRGKKKGEKGGEREEVKKRSRNGREGERNEKGRWESRNFNKCTPMCLVRHPCYTHQGKIEMVE